MKKVESSMDYIMFATADWDDPYWTNKQHVAVNLASFGNKILYIESLGLRSPKIKSKKDIRRILKRVIKGVSCLLIGGRKISSSIDVLSPLVIPNKFRNKHIRLLNLKILEFSIKRCMSNKRIKEAIIFTYHPYMLDIATRLNIKSIVYHCVDEISAVPGVDRNSFIEQEKKLLKKSKITFTTNINLKEKCLKNSNNVHFLPNVVDFEHFSNKRDVDIPESLLRIKSPRLVYHGVLSDFKINFKLLEEISMKKRDWNIVLIGTEREGQNNKILKRLMRRNNVYALGYRSYHELPVYLQHMDLGLLPLLKNKYTNNMFPMKFFEYISAGLRVVSTELAFAKNHTKGICTTSDTDDFIGKAEELLKQRKLNLNERLTIVGSNTWADRTKLMQKLIEETL